MRPAARIPPQKLGLVAAFIEARCLVLAIAVIEQQHGAALLHGRPCRIDACFELRGGSTYEGLKHPLAKKW